MLSPSRCDYVSVLNSVNRSVIVMSELAASKSNGEKSGGSKKIGFVNESVPV